MPPRRDKNDGYTLKNLIECGNPKKLSRLERQMMMFWSVHFGQFPEDVLINGTNKNKLWQKLAAPIIFLREYHRRFR